MILILHIFRFVLAASSWNWHVRVLSPRCWLPTAFLFLFPWKLRLALWKQGKYTLYRREMEHSYVSLLAGTCKYSVPEITEIGSQLRHKGMYNKTLVHLFFLLKFKVGKWPNTTFKKSIKGKTESLSNQKHLGPEWQIWAIVPPTMMLLNI